MSLIFYTGLVWLPGKGCTLPGSHMFCFCIFLFLTISVSPIILTSTGRIFTLFSAFDSAVAVDERRDPSRDVAIATNFFVFFAISFSRRNSKTTRDTNIVTREENTRNFVFCGMTPSVMTSGDSEWQNCFRFVLVLRVRLAQKVRDRSSSSSLQLVALMA